MDLFLPQVCVRVCVCVCVGGTYFRSTGSGFQDRAAFQNCHETWNLEKSARSCICTLFLPPGGVEIGLIVALQAVVSEIWTDFQNFHIWA